jgi:hypothetical protein
MPLDGSAAGGKTMALKSYRRGAVRKLLMLVLTLPALLGANLGAYAGGGKAL